MNLESASAPHSTYVRYIPVAWRVLAVIAYIMPAIFDVGVLFPIGIWILFRKSAFLRQHAVCAGLIQVIAFALSSLLRIACHFFVIEDESTFISPDLLLGRALFASSDTALTFGLVLVTLLFFVLLIPQIGQATAGDQRRHRATQSMLMLGALIASASPLFLYSGTLWGPDSGAQAESFFHLSRFYTFHALFPGHIEAMAGMTLSLVAINGRTFPFWPARALFVRFMREEKYTGEKRYRAARLRSKLIPGWGQVYAGDYFGGFVTLSIFLLVLMFAWISLGLNYGRFAEDIPFLNANFTWYFLTELGLRTNALPDKEFKAAFGTILALLVLLAVLALVYVYAWWNVRMLLGPARKRSFWMTVSHSLLLHVTPIAVLLLIPITIIPPFPSAQEQDPASGEEQEWFLVESFEEPEDEPELNGATVSGENGDAETTTAMRETRDQSGDTDTLNESETEETAAGETPQQQASEATDSETLGNAEEDPGERAGERRDQTYSNYLSVKIRGPEREIGYWDQMPYPYSAVFEYKIDTKGRVYDVRVVEPSGFSEADALTVRMIEAMNPVLPPPGNRTVKVTELFWNTRPGDNSLPSPLQQDLSHQFDGRVIRPLQ